VIRRLKKLGYEVHFFFLWVPTVELALTRVKARVMGGGHDVPETVVRRRFDRSIRNFLLLYRSLIIAIRGRSLITQAPRLMSLPLRNLRAFV
jgi:predicted ABC-type ATPase